MECRGVICSISCDSDGPANLNQPVYKHEFIIWLRARQNLELAFNLSELSHITYGASHTDFVILSSLFWLYSSVNGVAELFTRHAHMILLIVHEI